ncbi:hypothetical protein F4774DRAFT_421169 [Daldinia eschscholtzii]|nr:hypothetical protein F4774DRAFT_421169 [Daldinia eschscholtzii]
MYSRDKTVQSILRFYQEVTRHPYLDDDALIIPPANGWSSINVRGKTESVLELLRHLPYLCPIPICYTDGQSHDEIYPLPAHCVYLTSSVDREGTSLILDTHSDTITEYCHTGSYITVSGEEYDALPKADKWKTHRTTPITEFMDAWTRRYEKLVWMLVPNPIRQPTTGRFYSRADTSAEEDELLKEEQLKSWRVEDDTNHPDFENELDNAQDDARNIMKKHVTDVYNTYLRHGWPDRFDKYSCRSDLLQREIIKDAEDRRKMEEMNPDAELFD